MAPRVRTPAPTRAAPSRIVIEGVTPTVDGGRYPIKRVVGEPVDVAATVFADGHDHLRCVLAHQAPGQRAWTLEPMASTNPGLDRWEARFVPAAPGVHRYRVVAWIDEVGSWADGTRRKVDAGQDITSERLAGAALLEVVGRTGSKDDRKALRRAAEALRDGSDDVVHEPGEVIEAAHRCLRLAAGTVSKPSLEALVESERALFNTWYELFPRSWSPASKPDVPVHGSFRDVEANLGYVADLGFDVLYLPPIHPIGTSFRKGPNNAPVAAAGDHGSPWAIGSHEGGHTAIHPALGTLDDFRRLVRSATANELAVALDIAFQCSPDHPWVSEHPDWFRHRPDGSIQYAENPPKKYQDIYPLDFECDGWEALWEALLDVFLYLSLIHI